MKVVIYARYLLLINLLAFSPLTKAQTVQNQTTGDLPNPYQLIKDNLKRNNYITPIFDLKTREEEYLTSPVWKEAYLEMMILLQSYVGDYNEAFRYEDILYKSSTANVNAIKASGKEITDINASPIHDYKMLDALTAIESAANNQQVIMINEEHRTPHHRAVTLQLLARLYAKGFRYFAAETLADADTDLKERGYPTQATGFYTADPLFGDVVRTALRLGFKVVPYEYSTAKIIECSKNQNPQLFCSNEREQGQAQNLYDRILKSDPQAKIFVHVGRGHNSKSGNEKFSFMAKYFQEIAGINPFTVDQTLLSERRDTAYEQPLYRFLTKNNMLRQPSVFQSAKGGFYVPDAGYDMQIFHPRLTYKNGRATFLQMNSLRQTEKINLKKLKLKANTNLFGGSEPILIQAFYANESADAVPVDQIILYPNKNIPVLMLPAGNFRIRVMDKAGKILSQYDKRT